MKKWPYIIPFIIVGALLMAQTTYNSNRYKQAFYDGTREKTHATFAKFDTASLRFDLSATRPLVTMRGADSAKNWEFDGGKLYLKDSLSVGAGSVYFRKWFYSSGDTSIGMIFYNTTLARLDTIYGIQPGGDYLTKIASSITDSSTFKKQGTTPDTVITKANLPVKLPGLYVTGTVKIDGAVTFNTRLDSTKLADGSVTSETIRDGQIKTVDFSAYAKAPNVADADYGDVTVSSAAWGVEDNSHAHDSTTVSGIGSNDITDGQIKTADFSAYAKAPNVADADYGDVTVSTAAWAVEDDSHNHTTAATKFVVTDSLRTNKTTKLIGNTEIGAGTAWFTVEDSLIITSGVTKSIFKRSMVDVGEWVAPTGIAGRGYVMIGDCQEWAYFHFTSEGVVTLETNSTNVGTTNDVDAKLNIYDGGSGIVVENQLGSTLNCLIDLEYMTP